MEVKLINFYMSETDIGKYQIEQFTYERYVSVYINSIFQNSTQRN